MRQIHYTGPVQPTYSPRDTKKPNQGGPARPPETPEHDDREEFGPVGPSAKSVEDYNSRLLRSRFWQNVAGTAGILFPHTSTKESERGCRDGAMAQEVSRVGSHGRNGIVRATG